MLTFAGCIKEDLEICLPQTVSFNFAFIPSELCAEQPVIPSPINRLTVFVFDQHGRFVQEMDVPVGADYPMELSLEPAFYQFITVAGYDEEQLRKAPFVSRVTRLEDAAIATYLEQRDGTLFSAKEALFLGTDTLTVAPETPGQELTMSMVQRTKTLNIAVNGIATDRYQILLADNAAHYTFDNEQVYLTGSPPIYVPIHEDGGIFLGTVLINWPLNQGGNYTRLQIIDPQTGRRLVNEDFYELLLRVPGLDPDCAESFDISIEYRVDGKVIISINDWNVYDGDYILI